MLLLLLLMVVVIEIVMIALVGPCRVVIDGANWVHGQQIVWVRRLAAGAPSLAGNKHLLLLLLVLRKRAQGHVGIGSGRLLLLVQVELRAAKLGPI